MPVEFLTDAEAASYGRYNGPPPRAEMERAFFLDDADKALIARRRGDHNRLGFALQLTTVRSLGLFLADPLDVPNAVLEYLAEQLAVADPSCVKRYTERRSTRFEHAEEITGVLGLRDFAGAEPELAAWVDARAWTTGDGPKAIFNGVVDKVIGQLGVLRQLAEVTDGEIGEVVEGLWGSAGESTWNRNRAAVSSRLTWCRQSKRWAAPAVPGSCERRKEHVDATKDLPKAALERQISRRDVPLREKTLWRMLYETAARANEVLALDVETLDLDNCRAPIRSKGGETEWVYWGTGTAHLLPRLLRLPDGSSRTSGPLFLSTRRPVPARRPGPSDICPHTGRARLGYDRARILLQTSTGWNLHQLRHSAATHLGDKGVPLQLIMAKTRHKSPRTAMRYVNPGPAAVAEVTALLNPPRRTH